MTDAPDLAAERIVMVEACSRLAAGGLVIGTAGNLSIRRGPVVAVTPTGVRFDDVRAEDIVVVDLGGAVIAGSLLPTSELELHLGVHAARGDGAIVHTHAPLSTAVACVVDELPVIHYQLLSLGGAIRVAPYATFGTAELAAGVRAALEDRSAALMSNHGAVTWATTLTAALEATRLLEWVCGLYLDAGRIGVPRLLDAGQQAAVFEAAIARDYRPLRPPASAPDQASAHHPGG